MSSKKKRSRSRSRGSRPAAPVPAAPAPANRRIPVLPLLAGAAILAAAALYFALLRPKPPAVTRESGLNVLLITLDTTRADRLGSYGHAKARTPNLDAIAANGVRFANAYAPAPLTLPSHATILTGLIPAAHGVHNNGAYALGPDKATLARLLKENGARTAAFVSSFSVDSRFGLDQGFDLYDDNFQEGTPFKAVNAERKAEQVFKPFEAWMDQLGTDRFFSWVHFFDPHLPYSPPSPYREQFLDSPYDGEIAYMDFMIGQVMRKLRDRNLLARTLIVVAGDHGEAFGEKGESGHGVFLYEMAIRIPLLFYAEGHLPARQVVETRVRLTDVLPTVLDLLQLPVPDGLQGESLLPYIQKKKRKDLDVVVESFYPRENFGWAALTGLLAGPRKYIQAPKPELYDLAADPGETKDLAAAEPKAAGEMKTRLDDLVQTASAGLTASGRTLTAEEKTRLRSLGYVDYSDPSATGQADPKDKVEELRMVQDAEKAEFDGDFARAAELHAKMLELRPNSASSYVNLALAKARQKDFQAAVATLKRGLERLPGNELLMSRLGFTYLVTGRAAEAMTAMEDLLRISPRSIDALSAVAVILDGQGRKEEARIAFEKALAVEPENKFLRMSYAGNLASSRAMIEAIEVYEKLVRDFPQDTAVYRALGVAYGMSGEFDKAIESFKQVTYIAPIPDAYYSLALCYREKGDLAEAVVNFEKFLDDPKDEPEGKIRNARSELARLKGILGR